MNRDRMAWTQVLEGLGYQYDFLAYSQTRGGRAGEGRVPGAHPSALGRLSEKEAVAIEEFVAAGGTVIADLWPGVMDEHCKWRSGGRLDGLFGIDHGAVAPARLPAHGGGRGGALHRGGAGAGARARRGRASPAGGGRGDLPRVLAGADAAG